MHGEPLPKWLDIADSCLYIALEYLYKAYRAGIMTKEEAKEEKETLLYNYTTDKSKLEFLSRDSLNLSERISDASKEYIKIRALKPKISYMQRSIICRMIGHRLTKNKSCVII